LALIPGTRLGVYEVIAPIGAGSMGEVYRARDTRPELAREVAIKTLAGVAADADRDELDDAAEEIVTAAPATR
jgi:eukaryotic-like serine/threonine-protein kinase